MMLRVGKFGGMPRKLRVQYPGAIYHVVDRGDRREDIFLDDQDREQFLDTFTEVCEKTDWEVHAYCLMCNHFHLVIETPHADLVAGMKWFLGTYTSRFNHRHKEFGHVFSGRYKAIIVDGSGNGYLKTAADYVHLNPVRAKLLRADQPLQQYRWSSYPQYLLRPSRRPAWLRTDRVLGEWNIRRDDAAGRKEFERAMEMRKEQEESLENQDWKKLRRGWCWGPKSFRDDLLAMISEQQTEHHAGEELLESAEQKAEGLTQFLLARSSWKEQDLASRRKADPVKVQMALQLRQQTTMTWKWIAQRLQMGQWRSALNAVRQIQK